VLGPTSLPLLCRPPQWAHDPDVCAFSSPQRAPWLDPCHWSGEEEARRQAGEAAGGYRGAGGTEVPAFCVARCPTGLGLVRRRAGRQAGRQAGGQAIHTLLTPFCGLCHGVRMGGLGPLPAVLFVHPVCGDVPSVPNKVQVFKKASGKVSLFLGLMHATDVASRSGRL
jgi:hypothetical protein